jgi:(p)ppGpp synthase/HD superfamily hydrolase
MTDQQLQQKMLAEELVKNRIKGTRDGLPHDPNYLHSYRVRDLAVKNCPSEALDHEVFLAALLHDVIEDGESSMAELRKLGFSERTVQLVDLCSHDESVTNVTEQWFLMIARIVSSHDVDAWRIKLSDITDNLTRSHGLHPDSRKFMVEVKAPLMLRLAKALSASLPASPQAEALNLCIAGLEEELSRRVL